jgi:hypothetical protein
VAVSVAELQEGWKAVGGTEEGRPVDSLAVVMRGVDMEGPVVVACAEVIWVAATVVAAVEAQTVKGVGGTVCLSQRMVVDFHKRTLCPSRNSTCRRIR